MKMAAAPRETTPQDATEAAKIWVEDFGKALSSGSADALNELFIDGGTIRDFGALSWDVTNRIGRNALVPRLIEQAKESHLLGFTLTPEQAPVLSAMVRLWPSSTSPQTTA